MPYKFVHSDSLKEREVGHIMKLNEEPNHIECMDGPAQVVHIEIDEYNGDCFDNEAECDGDPGFGVIGPDIAVDVLVEFAVLRLKLRISRHLDNFNKLMQ